MKVFITDSKNRRLCFDIEESDTVNTLKNKFKNKDNINKEVELLFNGNILENEQAISDLDIKNGDNIIYLGEFTAG